MNKDLVVPHCLPLPTLPTKPDHHHNGLRTYVRFNGHPEQSMNQHSEIEGHA